MSTITLRSVKGSELTATEIDANFTNLNTDKSEKASPTFTGTVTLPNSLVNVTTSSYPSVQPSLNLDFANSKTVDPRITFVRNSTAAYYDGQTTAMAEQNLLLQSQTFATTWVTSNTTLGSLTTAPDGTTTAYPLTASAINGTLLQTFTATATAYTFSIYIQRVTGTGNIDITVDGTTYATQTTSGTWTRFTITTTPAAGSKTAGIRLATSGDVVNIWGAQLEQRSSVTAYNVTTTAAITNYIPVLMTAPAGVPRLDYNPTTGVALGLLIEESRTNLATYSSNMATAPWAPSNLVLTQSTIISPDGTLNGITFTRLATTTSEAPSRYSSAQAVSAPYTVSVYAKVGTTNNSLYIRNLAIDNITTTGVVRFNLTAGTIDLTLGSTYTGKAFITAVGNGWYRCSISGTTPATITNNLVDIGVTSSGTLGGTAGDYLFVWGAQLEAGSFATSYIPTVATTITRAADQASMTGTNFSSWYNQSQGSFYTAIDRISTLPNNWAFTVISSITFDLVFGPTNANFRYGVGGSTISTGVYVSAIAATSYTGATSTICVNGGAVISTTSTSIPLNSTSITIGNSSGSANYLSGHISKLSYYPVALSSSNLVALTS